LDVFVEDAVTEEQALFVALETAIDDDDWRRRIVIVVVLTGVENDETVIGPLLADRK